MKRERSGRTGIVILLVAVIALVVVSTISREPTPYDLHSSAPNGLGAVRILLADHGLATRQVHSDSPRLAAAGNGSVVFVPAPDMASREQLRGLLSSAQRGATVIYGSPPQATESAEDQLLRDAVANSQLVEAESRLTAPGVCDIAGLEDLGRIDTFFASPISQPLDPAPGLPARPEVDRTCYGTPDSAYFVELRSGAGRIIVLSSPYLWVNARLQPRKETDGKVLDNGVTALRLLSTIPGEVTPVVPDEVLFVKAVPATESIATGTKDPFELLPSSFKVLLAELGLALVLFIWWRGTRLGRPVEEASAVLINSSELTAAIGRLFEEDPSFIRNGAAAVLQEARTSLAVLVGLPTTTDPATLARMIARRTGRDPAEVHEVLFGERNIVTPAALVELENRIEQLRTEVLDVRSG